LKRITRKGGRKVWIFRWRETRTTGNRIPRKIVVGTVSELPTEKAARETLERLNLNINLDLSEEARTPRCFSELVEHYRKKELVEDKGRKAYSTRWCYGACLTHWIVPRWKDLTLEQLQNGVAVHIEEWLGGIPRSRGTRAKIRNIMSAVCSHAMRYGWLKWNPIRSVRQSAKRERVPVPLTAQEVQALLTELKLRERVAVLLAVQTGMRRGELLALRWGDIDFHRKTVNIGKSVWHQHLGPVKTEESEKVMPLGEEMVADLWRWRAQTPYAADGDWIFASARMKGRQPVWPESFLRTYVVPTAKRAGISKQVSWHVFRHTFSTLLAENGEDVKTVQALMRHANPAVTMGIYTHAVTSKKRDAQSRVVEMILPRDRKPVVVAGGTA
jgi:integrase